MLPQVLSINSNRIDNITTYSLFYLIRIRMKSPDRLNKNRMEKKLKYGFCVPILIPVVVAAVEKGVDGILGIARNKC